MVPHVAALGLSGRFSFSFLNTRHSQDLSSLSIRLIWITDEQMKLHSFTILHYFQVITQGKE